MHISIKWFNDAFNINLAAKEGAEDFLSIKGCRLKQKDGATFISFPAQKKQDGGWWNHVWANDKFQAAAIAKALEGRPENSRNTQADDSEDCPF